MKQKRTFEAVFILLAFLLMLLPLILTFNDALTRLAQKLFFYRFLQNTIVPLEVSMIGLLLTPLRIKFIPFNDGMLVNDFPIKIIWSCLGWQSLLLFTVSLYLGLKGGSYTKFSQLKTFILGVLGIFWVNTLRIVVTVLVALYLAPIFRVVYHDYIAAFVTVVFLFCYWWFCYQFVLEEK